MTSHAQRNVIHLLFGVNIFLFTLYPSSGPLWSSGFGGSQDTTIVVPSTTFAWALRGDDDGANKKEHITNSPIFLCRWYRSVHTHLLLVYTLQCSDWFFRQHGRSKERCWFRSKRTRRGSRGSRSTRTSEGLWREWNHDRKSAGDDTERESRQWTC